MTGSSFKLKLTLAKQKRYLYPTSFPFLGPRLADKREFLDAIRPSYRVPALPFAPVPGSERKEK